MKDITKYPYNLMSGFFSSEQIEEMPDDSPDVLEYYIKNVLKERAAEMVKLRYEQGMKYSAIAKKYNLSGNRISQIVTMSERRLFHPLRKRHIQMGLRKFVESGEFAKAERMEELRNYPYNLMRKHYYFKEIVAFPDDSGDVIKYLINKLSDKREREFVELKYKHGMTYKDIAAAFNMLPSEVSEITSRAVSRLFHEDREECIKMGMKNFVESGKFTEYENRSETGKGDESK